MRHFFKLAHIDFILFHLSCVVCVVVVPSHHPLLLSCGPVYHSLGGPGEEELDTVADGSGGGQEIRQLQTPFAGEIIHALVHAVEQDEGVGVPPNGLDCEHLRQTGPLVVCGT